MQREKNVGTVERGVRILGGGAAIIIGLLLLVSGPGSVILAVAEVALLLLGLDFFVTGITGYCPLYHRLGWSTARRQDRSAAALPNARNAKGC